MIRRRMLRSSAIFAASLAAVASKGHAQSPQKNLSKKLRESVFVQPSLGPSDPMGNVDPPRRDKGVYPWKTGIVTTTFWIGEQPTKNNPVPNHVSSWDMNWAKNYGGTDDPDRVDRANFMPKGFVPGQNPFYIALPYNDLQKGGHKPEASTVVPWFKEVYQGPTKSVLKGRWVAVRFKGKTAYAQWEDCGPFRTDHSAYVFGNERPKPNLNKGAGLDVSPAVRDFLGMADTDVTDWKFVEFGDVPRGPWATHGENNTFVLKDRIDTLRVTEVLGARKPEGG
jgi:hypothetical protein